MNDPRFGLNLLKCILSLNINYKYTLPWCAVLNKVFTLRTSMSKLAVTVVLILEELLHA